MLDLFAAYLLPAFLITVLPGPDTFMVLGAVARGGLRCGFAAILGMAAGLLLWGVVAALGLAALLDAGSVVYEGFRWVCVSYLLVLALRAWRSTRDGHTDPSTGAAPTRPLVAARRSFTTCALNPKLGAFFVALLPQFVPTGPGAGPVAMALVTEQAVVASLWYSLLALGAVRARSVLSRESVRRGFDRFSALVLTGFAARLAAD